MLPQLLSNSDRSKSKLLAEKCGIPIFDLGASPVQKEYGGLVLEKITNGYNYRYKPVNNQVIVQTLLLSSVNDATNTKQAVATFVIPGSMVNQGDYVELRMTCGGVVAGTKGYFTFSEYGTGASLSGEMQKTTVVAGTNLVTVASEENGMILITSANYAMVTGSGRRPYNNTSDIVVTFNFQYLSAGTGSNVTTFSNPTITYKSSAITSSVANMSNYRAPDLFPFREDTFWNVPLDTTATYGTPATDPMSVLIRDIRAGSADKVNGTISMFRKVGWGSSTDQSKDGIPFYYLKDTDPICRVKVKTTNVPRANTPYASKPVFNTDVPTTTGYIYMKMPYNQLPSGQTGDKVLYLISADKRWAIEVGQYAYDSVTNEHFFGYYFIHDLYGYGNSPRYYPRLSETTVSSQITAYQYGYQMAYRGGGTPVMAGIIRKADYDAGVINHMVNMQMDSIVVRTNRMAYVSNNAGAKTFTVKPKQASVTQMDYSTLCIAGQAIQHNAVNYTCTGINSYNSGTNETTFGVNEAIGAINSSLGVYFGTTQSSQFDFKRKWPLGECDGTSDNLVGGYCGIIPLGQVFAIPKSVNLASLGLTANGLMYATALQKYGAMLVDVAGGTFMFAQLEDTVPNTFRDDLYTDINTILNNIAPVTNYDYNLVSAAIANVAVPKLLPLVPIY
jgi:hypothetical protein